jgi:4a-hydroxytetrahydrobiopterin dehydratase
MCLEDIHMSNDITGKDFLAAQGLEGWRIISDGACAFYSIPSFKASARLVDAIGGIGGIDEHPPKLDVRHDGVTVRFLTKRAEGFRLTTTDLELAQAVARIASEHGLTAEPTAIQSLIVIPGATDRSAIMPFWQAVLGYQPRIDSPDEDLVDPHERDAAFWFEQMDEPRADGKGAVHVAVFVPIEQAQARIDAALAAGGRMVHDANAPEWWTLEDPAGNQADIASG